MDNRVGRRVVTGVDGEGRSCILSDGPSDVIFRFPEEHGPEGNWSEVHWMWSSDEPPPVPHQGSTEVGPVRQWFPGPGGSRLIVETLGPNFGVDPAPAEDHEGGGGELESISSMFSSRYHDIEGVHSSDTVDYAIVISGELWLETTDGTEVKLEPGDCVVQTGVRHTWRNRGSRPCQVAFVMIGAVRHSDPEAARDQR